MNPAIKGAIAFGTVAGAGGASYGIYSAMQPAPEKVKTYSEELKGTLLSTVGTTDQSKWEVRLASLQEVKQDTDLVESLRGLKQKNNNNTWSKLRDWCEINIKNSSKGYKDLEFQNIQSYCTFSIKEQISNPIGENVGDGDDKWLNGHKELAKIQDSELDETLKSDKKKVNDGQKKTAIKAWCTTAYKKPYKGKDDKDFKIASVICKSNT